MPEPSDLTKEEILTLVRDAAKTYGVPYELLRRQLVQESGLNPNVPDHTVKINGREQKVIGIAQFLDTTASALKVDPRNPVSSIYGAAKHMAELAKDVGEKPGNPEDPSDPTWSMALAAYNAGPNAVHLAKKEASQRTSFGADSWARYLPAETKEYLRIINSPGWERAAEDPNELSTKATEAIRRQRERKAGVTGATPNSPPDFRDFQKEDELGVAYNDYEGYQKAYGMYLDNTEKAKQLQTGPVSKYVDDVIEQMKLEIASGNLNVSKASSILSTRVSSYNNAMQMMNGDAFKYGSPVGAAYVPGREPGSRMVSEYGLHPLPNRGITINPLEEAMSVTRQAQDLLGSISAPAVPNIAELRKTALAQAASGVSGTDVGATPPATPASPAGTSSILFDDDNDPDIMMKRDALRKAFEKKWSAR